MHVNTLSFLGRRVVSDRRADAPPVIVAFLSIVPLEKLFDWGGEQLALYCGEDLGDLIVVTLNKCPFIISALAPETRETD